ncbi:MAG: metallophosphoesterase [Betaproteobacteria bacterium]|nr:metallophosphoesterase [Betaproteobacteria bacterium]
MSPVLVALLALALGACAAQAPHAAGPAFALMGDVPYSQAQANLLDAMIDEINAEPLEFVVHLGDITDGDGPCTDEWLEARQRQFARIRHPFVLVLGDNEWTDCHRSGFDPMERLARLRTLFHSRDPQLPRFERQSGEYPEHVRWIALRTLFVTLNVPGSNNNFGRTPEMDAEYAQRMRAVEAWLENSFELAARENLSAVALLMQANPIFERQSARERDGYSGLRMVLARHASRFPGPVLLAHGDTHWYRNDRPVPNLQRVEVFGSPYVRWLRAGFPAAGARDFPARPVDPLR